MSEALLVKALIYVFSFNSIVRETEKVKLSFLKRDTGVAEDVPSEALGSKRDKTKTISQTPEEEVSSSVNVKRKSTEKEEGSKKKRLKTSVSDHTSKTPRKVSSVKGRSSEGTDEDDESDSGVDSGDEVGVRCQQTASL